MRLKLSFLNVLSLSFKNNCQCATEYMQNFGGEKEDI